MHGHFRAESGDIFRELIAGLLSQQPDPTSKRFLRGLVQTRYLLDRELLAQPHRGKPRGMQDFVRIRVANAAKQARIGQRAFERVIPPCERSGERIQR